MRDIVLDTPLDLLLGDVTPYKHNMSEQMRPF